VLQCVAVCCNADGQGSFVCDMSHSYVRCIVLQYVAVLCSLLQCVAVLIDKAHSCVTCLTHACSDSFIRDMAHSCVT